jgi:ribosomal protein L37E
MSVQIDRNPLARATLMRTVSVGRRRSLHERGVTCRWCGQGADRTLYAYAWEADSIMRSRVDYLGPFCSVGCYRSFAA